MTNGLLFTFSANFSRATQLVPQVFSAQIDSPVLNLILAKVARAGMSKELNGDKSYANTQPLMSAVWCRVECLLFSVDRTSQNGIVEAKRPPFCVHYHLPPRNSTSIESIKAQPTYIHSMLDPQIDTGPICWTHSDPTHFR